MTVIIVTRRAHQNLTTYLFNSSYFERIAILIRLDGLFALKAVPAPHVAPVVLLLLQTCSSFHKKS